MFRDFFRVYQGRAGALRDRLDLSRAIYYQRKLELTLPGPQVLQNSSMAYGAAAASAPQYTAPYKM